MSKKIVFITLYDIICIGPRLLSSIAKDNGIQSYLIIFKGQQTRPIVKDSEDHSIYQFYIDGIKYGSCYAARRYTKKELDLLVKLISEINPDLLCLSTRSFGLSASKEIFAHLRKNNIKTTVIGGGWGPTLEPEKFLECCDYVSFGEGEKPFEEICHTLDNGESNDFSGVSNMIYYSEGKLRRNRVVCPVTDEELDKLPFPDFTPEDKYMIDSNRIMGSAEFYNKLMFNCFAARGCPLNCTYCMSSKYRDLYLSCGHSIRKYRVRRVSTVINELEIGKRQGAKFIRMNDEVFPASKNWVKEFLKKYKEKIDLPFFAYVRPEFHDPELIKEMVDAGLCSTIVGIQAGAERIRKKVFRRMLPTGRLMKFAETVKDLKLDYSYHLINFNPFETEQDMDETLELLYKLPYSSMFVFKLVPFTGTPIFRMIKDSNVEPLPDKIHKWYGFLYTMAVKGPVFRGECKVIHKSKLFRSSLFVFPILFFPSFLMLHFKKLLRKIVFGSYTLMPIPVKARKNE